MLVSPWDKTPKINGVEEEGLTLVSSLYHGSLVPLFWAWDRQTRVSAGAWGEEGCLPQGQQQAERERNNPGTRWSLQEYSKDLVLLTRSHLQSVYHILIAYQSANPWLRSEPSKVLWEASNDLSPHVGPAGTSMWEAVTFISTRVMLRYMRGPTSSWGAGKMLHIV